MLKRERNLNPGKPAPPPAETAASAEVESKIEPLALQSHVVAMHRLLKAAYLITQPFFANFADRYTLSMNELRILMTLAALPNAAAHQLARATGMHPMNVSRAIASLTNAGRVESYRDTTMDGRRKILSLTPEGWALHAKIAPHVNKMAEFMFLGTTELEVEFFSKLIQRLNVHLQDIDVSSPLLIDADAMQAEGTLDEDKVKPAKAARRARIAESD